MWKRLGFLFVFVVPALMPAAAWLGMRSGFPDLMAWFPLFFLFVLLPLADYGLGHDPRNPGADEAKTLEGDGWFRVMTLAALPAQLGVLLWSGWHFVHADFGAAGVAGWLLSQGIVGGVLAINVAHELIHKDTALERGAGGLLLTSVGYHGFKIEHVRGHHVHVSTPQDASSAPFGQNVYRFVLQSIPRNLAASFKLESDRLRRLGHPTISWRNEAIVLSAISLILMLSFGLYFGPIGALFFALQAAVAICTLEVINYVEHYGLERKQLPSGRYERTTHLHSWNSSYLLTNLLLFQLQRHSDHHENPRRRYQTLRHFDASPQLPGGYSAMFLLALVPPLWFKVMNPRVPLAGQNQNADSALPAA